MGFNWPLNVSSFTLWDKLKIGKFLLTDDKWTQGKWVRTYERAWEDYTGTKHAIMTASGSASNELIALRRREELQRAGQWPKRNKVIFPAVTWISSISPWINFGFEPVFVDVSAANMNSNYQDIKDAIKADTDKYIGTVFYTSLLGFHQDLHDIEYLCQENDIGLRLDNCESSFSEIVHPFSKDKTHICAFATCSTSLFFSHLTTTGTEGGLIFCKDDEEYEWYIMARSHGLTRGMPEKYWNADADRAFDFYMLGSNYRSHDLAAFMGTLDLPRSHKYSTDVDNPNSRIRLSNTFSELLNDNFEKPHLQEFDDCIPFCLPIVLSRKAKPDLMSKIKIMLDFAKVEYRPLISGNLLRQTPFKKYGIPENFPNADWLHFNACYVGLHKKVKEKNIRSLAWGLNSISVL